MGAAKHMGKVSATAMHDMLNVLAGIKETVGLMEDLLCRCKLDAATLQARFKTMLPAMLQQVGKGVVLAESLNRLGHLVADPDGPADAASLARVLVALTSRRARMRKLGVFVEETGPPCRARDPQALMCGLSVLLDLCYTTLPMGTELWIKLSGEGERGTARFHCAQDAAGEALAGLDAACGGLPRELTVQPETGTGGWRLCFPCAQGQ